MQADFYDNPLRSYDRFSGNSCRYRKRGRKNTSGILPRIRVRLRNAKLWLYQAREDAVMSRWMHYRWLVAVAIGLLGGLALSGLWPHTPLYALATDRTESYGMATGPLDAEVEAVYLLDFLTGDLKAFVLGHNPGTWTGFFRANVAADMRIDPQKSPKFMMVTGMINLRRGGGTRLQPSNSMCYIAEITTGQLAAYCIAWSPTMYKAGQPQSGDLKCIGVTRFRQPTGEVPAATPPPRAPRGRD
jgi:hypothetical protein